MLKNFASFKLFFISSKQFEPSTCLLNIVSLVRPLANFCVIVESEKILLYKWFFYYIIVFRAKWLVMLYVIRYCKFTYRNVFALCYIWFIEIRTQSRRICSWEVHFVFFAVKLGYVPVQWLLMCIFLFILPPCTVLIIELHHCFYNRHWKYISFLTIFNLFINSFI